MDSRGFSLLEMTVVIAILGMTSTIVSASYERSISSSRGSIQAEQLHNALVKARNTARYQLKCVTVDVQPDHLDIITWDSCSPMLAGPGPTETIAFDANISLGAFDSGNPLVFNAGGGTSMAAPSTMSATTALGKIYRYKVMPAIGSIAVLR